MLRNGENINTIPGLRDQNYLRKINSELELCVLKYQIYCCKSNSYHSSHRLSVNLWIPKRLF